MGHWRTLLSVAVCSLLVSTALAQSDQQPPAPTLRVTSTLVFLDVTVLDKKGHPVDNLAKDDFTITEDKKPQSIFSFEAPGEHIPTLKSPAEPLDRKAPVNIIVLDLLNSRFEDFAYIRYSVRNFLLSQPERLSTPTEMLVIGNESLDMLQGFTRNRNELLDALAHLPAALPWKRMNASFFWDRFVQSLDALQQVALQNTGVQGRKNVIWVGHGGPSILLDPVIFPGKSAEKIERYVHSTANLLVNARVSLYVIYPGLPVNAPAMSLSESQADADVGETDPFAGDVNFGLFVNETGGKLFFNRNDVDAEIQRSEQLGSNYYTLTYQPRNVQPDGKFRRIRVRVRDASYRVVTKAGYYARTTGELANPHQKQMNDIAEALRAAIPFGTLQVSIANLVRHPDSKTIEFTATLRTKNLNLIPNDDGSDTAGLIAGAVALDGDRTILAARLRHAKVTATTSDTSRLPAIAWQQQFTLPLQKRTRIIRVAIVDQDGGRIGTAEVDRKLLLTAREESTPNPALIPSTGPHSSSASHSSQAPKIH